MGLSRASREPGLAYTLVERAADDLRAATYRESTWPTPNGNRCLLLWPEPAVWTDVVMGGLVGDLGIAGSLLCDLTGKAGQPGSVTLGRARIASDADRVAGGLSFGEMPGRLSRISCREGRGERLSRGLL